MVVVVVVGVLGRTGTTILAVEDNGGQVSEPHARSVGQQPPPKEEAQDRKPEEQVKTFGVVDVVDVVVVVVVVVLEVEGVTVEVVITVIVVELGGITTVMVVVAVVGVNEEVEVGDWMTKTVAVELTAHPTL